MKTEQWQKVKGLFKQVGLGNWFLINDEREKAEKIFRQITNGNQWSSFGYIAAEAELKRLN